MDQRDLVMAVVAKMAAEGTEVGVPWNGVDRMRTRRELMGKIEDEEITVTELEQFLTPTGDSIG